MRLVTAAEMREIDRQAIKVFGIPGLVLMENAGLKVVEAVKETLGTLKGKTVVILAGKGNNGGDGFVAARHLANAGAKVRIMLAADPNDITGDARVNFDICRKQEYKIYDLREKNALQVLHLALMQSDLVVDALYGTGFRGQIKGRTAEVVNAVNEAQKPVIAVDIPSGVEADTGKVNGPCIKATRTVTFGLPKVGLVLEPALLYVGQLCVADISLPPSLISEKGSRYLLTRDLVRSWLTPRPLAAHKGQFGHVLVVAGSRGMSGAACLAAVAAVRSGAGLVTLAVPAGLQDVAATKVTEAMTLGLAETAEGTLSPASWEQIMEFTTRASVMVLGPGLSTHPETVQLVKELISTINIPCVLDADALNALAGEAHKLKAAKAPLVITPHPGEMGRLLNTSPREIQSDRLKTAEHAAHEWGCTVVLKGARTIIAGSEGVSYINPTGNPGMASGGTGDVLAGTIAGLLAQRLEPLKAAAAGVYCHGSAGDMAAEEKGQHGLIAGDIIEKLPYVLKEIEISN